MLGHQELTLADVTEAPFRCIEEAGDGLRAIEDWCRVRDDRRAGFAMAYIVVTREIREMVDGGRFADPELIRRQVVSFANLYRAALHDHSRGFRNRVPRCWLETLDRCEAKEIGILMALIASMACHIINDLPLAAADTLVDFDAERAWDDYSKISHALSRSIPKIQAELISKYAPHLAPLHRRTKHLNHLVTLNGVIWSRNLSWMLALGGRTPGAQRRLLATLADDRAAAVVQWVGSSSRWLTHVSRLLPGGNTHEKSAPMMAERSG